MTNNVLSMTNTSFYTTNGINCCTRERANIFKYFMNLIPYAFYQAFRQNSRHLRQKNCGFDQMRFTYDKIKQSNDERVRIGGKE